MEKSKGYYAFLSYKREDKKEAKPLQLALEYYHLPNYLRQEDLEMLKYVRPIFYNILTTYNRNCGLRNVQ